jgi:hypothetical protein
MPAEGAGGSGIRLGSMYDSVATAGSTGSNGGCARHRGKYGDFTGFVSCRRQAGAYRFRRRPADFGCQDIAAGGTVLQGCMGQVWCRKLGHSGDPYIARASELEHPVQAGSGDGDFGGLGLISSRSKGIADHAFVSTDRRLDLGPKVVATGFLPAHAATFGDFLDVLVPLCQSGFGRQRSGLLLNVAAR